MNFPPPAHRRVHTLRTVSFDVKNPPTEVLEFLTERHLATLAIARGDLSPQLTPVGVTYDAAASVARVITWSDSYKARLLQGQTSTNASICQVDGGRWLTLYGVATLSRDAAEVETAVAMYTRRYRPPKERLDRVVILVDVKRMVGRVPQVDRPG